MSTATALIRGGRWGSVTVGTIDVLQNVHDRGGYLEVFTSRVAGQYGEVENASYINDLRNGSYTAHFSATLSGTYDIAVLIRGAHVTGSPQQFVVVSAETAPVHTAFEMVAEVEVAESIMFSVFERDVFGNDRVFAHSQDDYDADRIDRLALPSANLTATPRSCTDLAVATIVVAIYGPLQPDANLSLAALANGTQHAETNLTARWAWCESTGHRWYQLIAERTGLYVVSVSLGGEEVVGSPRTLMVRPRPLTVLGVHPELGPQQGGSQLSVAVDYPSFSNFKNYLGFVGSESFVCVFDGGIRVPASLEVNSSSVHCEAPPAAVRLARLARLHLVAA
jgi:hypothetical protein